LLNAAELQARQPHHSTLPTEGYVERVVVDDAGQKKREFFGRESFIKDFSTPARLVRRIISPKHAKVLYGEPYSRVPD
jgi:hypothetical protein